MRDLELEVLPEFGSLAEQPVEHLAVEAKCLHVATGAYRERARGLLEQPDLAKRVARFEHPERELAIRGSVARGVLDDACSAGHQQIERVGRFPLAHDRHSECERHRLEAVDDVIAHFLRQEAEDGQVRKHLANLHREESGRPAVRLGAADPGRPEFGRDRHGVTSPPAS